MLHHDYFMRQISQLVQVLRYVLGLTKKERYAEALDALDEALQEFVGLSLDSLLAMPAPALFNFLSLGGGVFEGQGKLLLAVALLNQAGDTFAAQGDYEQSDRAYRKALELLLAVITEVDENVLPEYIPRVAELLVKLESAPLPLETWIAIFHYHEARGAYAEAEDLLFELVEIAPDWERVVEVGLAFYDRLLAKSDAELIEGGLSRDEIAPGRADLLDSNHR